jgi:hypothetical protein
MSRPTFGVSGGGAGADAAGEQRKLEARKMLGIAQTPIRQVHAVLDPLLIFVFPEILYEFTK